MALRLSLFQRKSLRVVSLRPRCHRRACLDVAACLTPSSQRPPSVRRPPFRPAWPESLGGVVVVAACVGGEGWRLLLRQRVCVVWQALQATSIDRPCGQSRARD